MLPLRIFHKVKKGNNQVYVGVFCVIGGVMRKRRVAKYTKENGKRKIAKNTPKNRKGEGKR